MNALGRYLDRWLFTPVPVKGGGGAGEKPGRVKARLGEVEVIGAAECPIIYRWTILDVGRTVPDPEKPERMVKSGVKVMLHRFPGFADDRDPHNHPRPFLTVIFAGHYFDVTARRTRRMGAGAVAYRRSSYTHITRADAQGAWTLVVMGPLRGRWGFYRDGRWLPWRLHERLYGPGMKCP